MSQIPLPTVLTSGEATSATSGTTASISPIVGQLIFVAVYNSLPSTGSANLPSISGLSITWYEVATHQSSFNSGRFRVTLFVGVITTPTSGALSITFSSQSQKAIVWGVFQPLTNIPIIVASPQDAIVQTSAAETNSTSTSLETTLATFANPNNATIGIIGCDGSNPVDGSEFSNVISIITGSYTLLVEFASTPQPNVNFTYSSDSVAKVMLAAELSYLSNTHGFVL